MNREPGFYWVRHNNLGWIVANWWKNGYWTIPYVGSVLEEDSQFAEIDERRIERQK